MLGKNMFNDYPTIGTPDGMRNMTEEEMKERDIRQFAQMQNAWPDGIVDSERFRGAQNAVNMHARWLLDNLDNPKPKPTMWQRLKRWIAN